MSAVITEVCEWAREQPAWEQETLRRIFARESFDEAAYATIEELLISGRPAAAPDFSAAAGWSSAAESPKPRLVSISEVTNVNALVADQRLEFGPELTTIYGGNGTGKSGYARIFGSACFSRGDRTVLPNVFAPATAGEEQRTVIIIEQNGTEKTFEHRCRERIPELSGFYVFDTTCANTHLSQPNTLTFAPAGLATLHDLVVHTDVVRQRVRTKVDSATRPSNLAALFEGESTVSRQIAALSASTDLEALRNLAGLSPEETSRIDEVDREIAKLKAQEMPKTIRTIRHKVDLGEELVSALARIEENLSAQQIAQANTEIGEWHQRKATSEAAGAAQFSVEGLRGVGTAAWNDFVRAAKALAEIESDNDNPYPADAARCLLCQQRLSTEAAELLRRLWKFLHGEARQLLGESEQKISARERTLQSLDPRVIDRTSTLHAALSEEAETLLKETLAFTSAATTLRDAMLHGLRQRTPIQHDGMPQVAPLRAQLYELIAKWKTEVESLEKADPAQTMAVLGAELRALQHRRTLAANFGEIADHVERLKWAQTTEARINSSRHITTKYNDLFDQRVTGAYQKAFEQFLKQLGRPLKVHVGTRAQKGSALKVLELTVPEGSPQPSVGIQHIFSEGEKRAVALADFLSEVTLDEASAGIVLDDPVTSLDAEWKELIARAIVDQARERQVILFTHDLHFLYLVRSATAQMGVEMRTHWIRYGAAGPGYIYLDNSPAAERDYKSTQKAGDFCNRAANSESPEEQDRLLKDGFAALRTTYEVFVLNDLFNNVVGRFEERISIERLRDAAIDAEIVEAVIDKVGLLSRYIEGHSHSDSFVAAGPLSVDKLREEIDAFTELRNQLKQLKKDRNKDTGAAAVAAATSKRSSTNQGAGIRSDTVAAANRVEERRQAS